MVDTEATFFKICCMFEHFHNKMLRKIIKGLITIFDVRDTLTQFSYFSMLFLDCHEVILEEIFARGEYKPMA